MHAAQHTVRIEHPYDDLDAGHVVQLIVDALVAYGYAEQCVRDAMRGDE